MTIRGFAGAGPADQDGIALLDEESAIGEIAHERLVDRCTLELQPNAGISANASPRRDTHPMTDQAMLTEMARLLAIIERYWATHFSTGDEIDALTVHQVRAILADIG